jgi:transcriptional regulator with XRE-family HTH domain
MRELPDRWQELGEFIREQRGVARLSLRRLSDMAGISNPYLSQIERGLRKPSAEILQQIAKALRISAETLYVRAGILEARADGPGLAEEILRDPTLTEDQKETLIKVYSSFVHQNTGASAGVAPASGSSGSSGSSAPSGSPGSSGSSVSSGSSDDEATARAAAGADGAISD